MFQTIRAGLMALFLITTSTAAVDAPVILPADQPKLTAALTRARTAQMAFESAAAEYRAVMFEAMANAGCSPQKFELSTTDAGQFICKEKVAPSPTPKP